MMVKRRDLIKELKRIAKDDNLEYTEDEGGNHTIIRIGNRRTAVPRHNEIADPLANQIRKQAKGTNTK